MCLEEFEKGIPSYVVLLMNRNRENTINFSPLFLFFFQLLCLPFLCIPTPLSCYTCKRRSATLQKSDFCACVRLRVRGRVRVCEGMRLFLKTSDYSTADALTAYTMCCCRLFTDGCCLHVTHPPTCEPAACADMLFPPSALYSEILSCESIHHLCSSLQMPTTARL